MKLSSGKKLGRAVLNSLCQFSQNANNLLELRLMQPDQLVIQFQDSQRFHENGCATGRGPVNYSLHTAFLVCPHGYDKASVANSDQLVLKLARIVGAAQHGLQFAGYT